MCFNVFSVPHSVVAVAVVSTVVAVVSTVVAAVVAPSNRN